MNRELCRACFATIDEAILSNPLEGSFMNIVLAGRTGAGKGTQVQSLLKSMGMLTFLQATCFVLR